MQEAEIKYITWVLFAVVGILITFYVFGVELPLYLIIAIIGLFLYIYSGNPLLKFSGGWIGRVAAVLFFVSLLYYIGTGTFFPENIFEFRFLIVGIGLINEQSKSLGGFVLNLFR